MSTPADQLPMSQPPQSPLDQYMATYGAQLQSMLANDPGQGAANDPGIAAAGRTSDLGPDLYRPQLPQIPRQSALEATQGQGPGSATPPQPPRSALSGSPAQRRAQMNDNPEAQAAAARGEKPQNGQGDGLSFRDMWNQQDKDTRQKYLDQLQDHLKQANESIDSAYKEMMQKMGGRPDKSLSKDQKGMLLMEFGLRMMEHSRPQYGQTNSTAGAVGQAGTETLQSAKGLIAGNVAQQQRYDQMQQQLAIAGGKEKAQLASRSALETGRDVRAFGQQESMLERTQMQQTGAGQRNEARIAGQADRTATTEAGKDRRAAAAAGQVKRTVTANDGSMYGVTGNGTLVQLGKDGQPIKAPPGGTGSGKLTAAQANYNLYMDANGKDASGQPLTGQDLQNAQQEALKYAANPRAYQLSEPQMRQMAEKSADTFIRANPTSWLGMAPEEVEAKRAEYAENEFNRLKRGGPATPAPPPGPHSALGATVPGAPQAPPGAPKPSGGSGAIPTQPPPNMPRGPNAAQLDALQKDPQRIAPYFLKKFGYLPREFHQFVQSQPQSALSR